MPKVTAGTLNYHSIISNFIFAKIFYNFLRFNLLTYIYCLSYKIISNNNNLNDLTMIVIYLNLLITLN